MNNPESHKGLIAWFVKNPIAANMLMILIAVAGFMSLQSINKQLFPIEQVNWIKFSAEFPGAAPQEVEENITIRIEEALKTVQGLVRVVTLSDIGYSSGFLQVDNDEDPQEVLNEIKSKVDAITNFPSEVERLQIEIIEDKQDVMFVSLYGELSAAQLKDLGTKIDYELRKLPHVRIVEFKGGLSHEISVEVSKEKLREYDLNLSDIALAIQNNARNISAGQIKTDKGLINLRVKSQAYKEHEFATIPVATTINGSILYLSDIADIEEGFEEGIQYTKIDGQNAVTFFIGATENQSITDVGNVVKQYVNQKSRELPPNVKLETWVDMTYYLNGRLEMMSDNLKVGALLVFLLLTLFLRLRVAFWVMMGIPVCFLGAFIFMPLEYVEVTINITSLFAFILVLGIVVDDAIVIGESAYNEMEENGYSKQSVITGVKRVALPATLGVLTTIVAFTPLMLSDGPSSGLNNAIGFVVVFCLIFSLIESKLILPAHLASVTHDKKRTFKPLEAVRSKIDGALKSFINHFYLPKLAKCIEYRYSVLAAFFSILLLFAGLMQGGVINFIGNPKIPHDFPRITIEMNLDASEQQVLETTLVLQNILLEVDRKITAEHGNSMIDSINIGVENKRFGYINVKLVEPDERVMDTFALANIWRDKFPSLPGVKSLNIADELFGNDMHNGNLSFRLQSLNEEKLTLAAHELKQKLNSIAGVSFVSDSRRSGVKEVQLDLKPIAYSLGFTLVDITRQVNHAVYGFEAQRIMRHGEEIKVMVRYPEHQRDSVHMLENMLIRGPKNIDFPLAELVEIKLIDGIEQIRREDGFRTINVWAGVDSSQIQPWALAQDIRQNFIPELLRKHPLVKSELFGRIHQEMRSNNDQLKYFVIALIFIFAIIAIPLKSYTQAIMIMSVIPFGVCGALFGHLIFGIEMTTLSIFGIVAVAGVVVNDSLVLVDCINNAKSKGMEIQHAVMEACKVRFRAIFLTSFTTFIGLVPIIFFETSLQAKIVIPMAISMSFGILFATAVTLLLIPIMYLMTSDLNKFLARALASKLSAKPIKQN